MGWNSGISFLSMESPSFCPESQTTELLWSWPFCWWGLWSKKMHFVDGLRCFYFLLAICNHHVTTRFLPNHLQLSNLHIWKIFLGKNIFQSTPLDPPECCTAAWQIAQNFDFYGFLWIFDIHTLRETNIISISIHIRPMGKETHLPNCLSDGIC